MKNKLHRSAAVLLVACSCHAAFAADEHFTIKKFDVVGNHLLSENEINAALASSVGADKAFGDIQKALEALGRR